MSAPILNSAPAWQPARSEFILLWHGCTAFDKNAIETHGIDLNCCKADTDFGRGFYTTTIERQARHWAWSCFYDWMVKHPSGTGNQPVVLRFRVRRYGLTGSKKKVDRGLDNLHSLHFVVGDYDNDDFWSLVQHCRQSTPAVPQNHKRLPGGRGSGGWYDLVTGPVAAFWRQKVAMAGADQISFHTNTGINILNALIDSGKKGSKDDYEWSPVP